MAEYCACLNDTTAKLAAKRPHMLGPAPVIARDRTGMTPLKESRMTWGMPAFKPPALKAVTEPGFVFPKAPMPLPSNLTIRKEKGVKPAANATAILKDRCAVDNGSPPFQYQ